MNKFVLESKPTDGRYGLPDIWRAETLPLDQEVAEETLKKREDNVTKYDGQVDFTYRLTELKEEEKVKKRKVKKKS